MLCLVSQSCPTLYDPEGWAPPGCSVHGDSPGKNTGVGCHALLQGIFPTQGSNPGPPHCRQNHYCLSHQGSPFKPYLFPKFKIISIHIFHITFHYSFACIHMHMYYKHILYIYRFMHTHITYNYKKFWFGGVCTINKYFQGKKFLVNEFCISHSFPDFYDKHRLLKIRGIKLCY